MPGKKQNRKNGRKHGSRQSLDRPLQLTSFRTYSNMKVRYINTQNNAAQWTMSPAQLITSLFVVGEYGLSNKVISIVEAVRVRYVEAWTGSQGGSTFAPQQLSLGWEANDYFGRDVMKNDVSITASQAAHVRLTPVKGHTSSMWQSSASTQPWILQAYTTVATVLDICFDFTMNYAPLAVTANADLTVAASPADGRVYFTLLQTSAGTSNTWTPQGVNSIV